MDSDSTTILHSRPVWFVAFLLNMYYRMQFHLSRIRSQEAIPCRWQVRLFHSPCPMHQSKPSCLLPVLWSRGLSMIAPPLPAASQSDGLSLLESCSKALSCCVLSNGNEVQWTGFQVMKPLANFQNLIWFQWKKQWVLAGLDSWTYYT